jgi:hypothetical protein
MLNNHGDKYQIVISTHVTENVNIDFPSVARNIPQLTDGWEDPWTRSPAQG